MLTAPTEVFTHPEKPKILMPQPGKVPPHPNPKNQVSMDSVLEILPHLIYRQVDLAHKNIVSPDLMETLRSGPTESNVTLTELEVGQGHVIQDHQTITMWYLCKVLETGYVYQHTMTADGPPVESVLTLFWRAPDLFS